jgi:hypothetical protein
MRDNIGSQKGGLINRNPVPFGVWALYRLPNALSSVYNTNKKQD